MKNIAVQSFLRPALTPVIRCKDYTVFLETMERIDRVLIDSSLEREAIVKALEGWDEAGGKDRGATRSKSDKSAAGGGGASFTRRDILSLSVAGVGTQ